jgi:predicted dinucleotide-binding enzyme
MDIATVGTGSVAESLGVGWARAAHRIRFGSRRPEDGEVLGLVDLAGERASAHPVHEAVAPSEAVVLAVPSGAVDDVLAGIEDDVAGKPLLDATNQYPSGGRARAQHVRELAPDAHVVKAFNTVGANVMADPSFGGRGAMLPVAGDDPDVKGGAMDLARDLGFEPFDAGGGPRGGRTPRTSGPVLDPPREPGRA